MLSTLLDSPDNMVSVFILCIGNVDWCILIDCSRNVRINSELKLIQLYPFIFEFQFSVWSENAVSKSANKFDANVQCFYHWVDDNCNFMPSHRSLLILHRIIIWFGSTFTWSGHKSHLAGPKFYSKRTDCNKKCILWKHQIPLCSQIVEYIPFTFFYTSTIKHEFFFCCKFIPVLLIDFRMFFKIW